MKQIRIILALVALSAGGGIFAQSGTLTPELLWQLGRVGLDDVSPDGSQIVYGVTTFKLEENSGNRNLYVIPSKGGQIRKVTAFEGSESNARWRADGSKIGFLSSESGSRQLWEMNPDGSNKGQVTNIEGGISGFEYSPDGSKILLIKEVKLGRTTEDMYPDLPEADARIIDDLMYRHWDEWDDYSYRHIFVADYEDSKLTGEPVDIMRKQLFDAPMNPFGGMEQIAWSPDGTMIAYTCKKLNGREYTVSTNSDIYVYDLTTDRTLNFSEGMMGYDRNPAFSPDGQYLAWNSMEREGFESDRERIFVYELKTTQKWEVTTDFDQNAGNPHWSANSKEILFSSGIQATYQICAIGVDGKDYRQITEGEHNINGFHLTDQGAVAELVTMSSPRELYSVDLDKGKMEALTTTNEGILRNVQMGKVEKRMVKAVDGKEILTWVIYPPDFDEFKEYPTLLYCQGGPQSAVSQFFSYRWNFQLMAANGYIVVAPNRRGLPSFGRVWNDEISGRWGDLAMQDYLSAIDELKQEDYVDEDRLGAVGASFGGYSVYWLAGNHQKRFKAFIAHAGLFNMESWYGTTEEMFFANWDLRGAYWEPKPNPSYLIYSPHKYVQNWDTPIMVIHGEQDFRVPIGQGMEAFQAAQLQGIPSRFLYFPGEGHWILNPQNGMLWHREFFGWLDKWLKSN